MKVIVVGCGRIGSELAYRLYQKGHQVVVIDNVGASFNSLRPDFRGRTVEGEALQQDVLHRAGIEQADALAAVTNSDSLNAVVAHVAREVYKVPHVVVRNFDPHWRDLHETFGLPVVSSTSWGAQRIEELLYHEEVRVLFSAGNGEVEIYEFTIPAAWEGRTLGQLLPASEAVAVALTRAGKAILPTDDTVVEEDDVIQISATLEGVQTVRRELRSAAQEA